MSILKTIVLGFGLVVFIFQTADAVCPAGWLSIATPPTTQCYKIFPMQKKNFNQAQRFCTQQHGYLATEKSLASHNLLKPNIINTKLIANAATSFWIGLTDNNTNAGPWKWIGGQPFSWTYFLTPPNNTINKQDCGFVVSAEPLLKWHVTNNCNLIKGTICQIDFNYTAPGSTIRPITLPPVSCDPAWTPYPLKRTCLRLYSTPKSWFDARQFCKDAGGDLVKVADSAFNSFVDSLIAKQIGDYWIGLNDQKHENRFEWLDETVQATFTYWSNNEPNNYGGNENCVVTTASNAYKWNDSPCDTKYRYICQKSPNPNGVVPVTTATTVSPNCYPGWQGDPNSDNCYQINRNMMSWLDARTACQTAGGDLTSITSVQEQFFLSGRLMSMAGNFFWIGANDRATEKGFEWTDKSPFAFLNWNAGQPDNSGESDCVVITKATGRWDDLPCNSRYGFICKRKGRVTTPTAAPVTSPARLPAGKIWGCPGGWFGNRGYCYMFASYINGTTYSAANMFCASKGANLVSIRDDVENRFILSHVPAGYNAGLWIGLNDISMENSFIWSDNSRVTYTNWSPGEPNNQNNEDCVTMLYNGKWNDGQCDFPIRMAVCKMQMSQQQQGTPMEQRGCPAGSIGYLAQCYTLIDTQTVNYNQAKANCRTRNGYLATVDNVQIQSFLSSQLFGKSYSAYWMGLSSTNRNYVWASGRQVSFTSWSNTYTGNLINTCVAMQTANPVGLWVDTYPCTRLLPYICESPRVGFTTPRTTVTTTSLRPCPTGWTARGNLCYKAYLPSTNITMSWMGARAYCGKQAIGATLVTIPNSVTENWVKTTLLGNRPGSYWIGLNDRDNEAGFSWTDGSGLTYTNWAAGEPNDYLHGEDCVVWTLPVNKWNDLYCYVANSFICQVGRGAIVPTTRPTVTPGRNSPQCGNSTQWTLYSGFCYYVSTPSTLVTWFQARLACKDMSAELTSISNDDENGYVTTMISQSPIDSFWIGLNDLEQETYSWTDISPISYVNWNARQPDDSYGGEQCVEINSQGRWNDQYCQEKRGYVCKKRLGNFTPPPWTTPSVKGGCPRDFTSLPSLPRCYYVGGTTQNQRKTFNQSIQACALMAHKPELASVHSKLEEKYIITLIANLQWPAWIGFNDMKVRNRFGWVDNLNVDFTNWGLRQPDENLQDNNPANRRDCVDMQYGTQNIGKWDDNRCSDKYAYVCEARKEDTLPTVPPNTNGCPNSYLRFQNSCYKYYSYLFNWTDAEGYCMSEKGHLVSLSTVAEQAFVEILTQHVDAIQLWVGLTFSLSVQGFAWTDGWPVTFTNWGTGEPDLAGMTACVSHTVDGQWQDNPCVMKMPFVCEINLGQPPTPKPTIPVTLAACPNRNWQLHGSYCYYLERTLKKSWPGANYACTMLGSTLLTIHSDDEAKFITFMVTPTRLNAWIGLRRGEGLGFGWTDRSPVEYLYWGQNEPSDPDSTMHQDCVRMSGQDGTWADTDCFDINPYICKIAATLATSSTPVQTQPTGQNTPYNPNSPSQVTNSPSQVTNSPSQVTYSQNTPYNPYNTPLNPGSQSSSSQVIPAQSTTVYFPPMTQKSVGGNGNNNDSGLSGGSVAGIVLGCLAIVAVAVTVMFVARKYFNLQIVLNKLPFSSSNNSGFDNATYSATSGDKVNLQFSET
ncbi:macrophage mannose receptor 1 [Biomphalaria glabrata]|nr:macrophage mannose receptor 1-like; partial [Biomphalaria glabrata]